MSISRPLITLALVAAAALAPSSAVAASGITVEHTRLPLLTSTVSYAPCGLTETTDFDRTAIRRYDADGTLISETVQIDFHGVVTDPASGQTWTDSGHQVLFYDPVADTLTFTGEVFHVADATGRTVFVASGKIVVDATTSDTFFNARNEPTIGATDAAVCGALVG